MGLKVENLANAASGADVVMLLLPDQVMADVYNSEIADNIKEGATLLLYCLQSQSYKHLP